MKLILLFVSLSVPVFASAQEKAPYYLEVGEQRLLTYESLYKYSISGNAVRYVRISNRNQLLLKAQKAGIATLTVFTSPSESETRILRVEQRKNLGRPSALLQALNALKETEVIDGGNHFVLRGKVMSVREASAIRNLIDHYPTSIVNETEIEPLWFERNRIEITHVLRDYPTLQLQAAEGAISVVGGLSNSTLVQAITRRILGIQPLTMVEIQTLKDNSPTIYFKVFLLEVKKETLLDLGVQWPGTAPLVFQLSPTKFLINNSLDLTIHALSERGMVRILSSPELVVRAPGQAELFAGGEMPIRQRSVYNDSVTWKNIGLGLRLDVKEYAGDKVRLSVETQLSHLDESLRNDEIPGIQSNQMKTMVDATLGKPLLLSGLLQEDFRERVKGLPGLSRIPILGKLFGSEDYRNSRSELVAILLPHREAPQNPMQRISSDLPKGYLPIARNFISAHDLEELKNDSNYPWNAL